VCFGSHQTTFVPLRTTSFSLPLFSQKQTTSNFQTKQAGSGKEVTRNQSKTMENHLRRAAYLNSNGCSMLAVGENAKAFKALKGALQNVLQAVMLYEDNPVAAAASERPDTVSRPVPRSRMDGASMKPSPEENDSAYIYSKGLVFYLTSNVTLLELAFYASVIVFNLVLAFQRRRKPLQERDLNKLLALYDLCLRLIHEGSKAKQYDSCNLIVATLNNKAVVHAELRDFTKARRVLYHVWDVMKYPKRRPGLLEQWEIEGIFLNIYQLLVNSPQTASAA
jgi:hypothetical protein